MMGFIGEDLSKREIAALQAVAHNAGGARFGHLDRLKKTIADHRDCWEIEEIDSGDLAILLAKLEDEKLIETKLIKEKMCVGLTDDGRRCNLISEY